MMHNIADPDDAMFMVRLDSRRLIPMSYVSPIETEYWDDDGSPEYRMMFERIEREGWCWREADWVTAAGGNIIIEQSILALYGEEEPVSNVILQ